MDTAENDQAELWVLRLRDGYRAGYYKTEAAEGQQQGWPFQGKFCRDCPFFLKSAWHAGGSGSCTVHAEQRQETSPTCRFHDPCNHEEGQRIIDGTQDRVKP